VAPLTSVGPSSPSRTQPADHRRAQALLVEATRTEDDTERCRLREEAVLLTLDLAECCASRYRGRGVDLDDLVQVARMALVKAARGYVDGRGSGFDAYATVTINGELKRYFRDCSWSVRPPRHLQESRALVAGEEERLRHSLHREPTTDEVAEALRLDRREVEAADACHLAFHALSLDAPGQAGTGAGDLLVAEEDTYEAFDTSAALGGCVAALSERERRILRMRFVEECTQAQIGAVLGVSQMQVSRLLTAILAKLREGLVEHDAVA
jgi:RNA polymerase sigma-B factor